MRAIHPVATILGLILASTIVQPARAGVAHRVADLRTEVTVEESYGFSRFGRVGPLALLSLDKPGFGSEPWTSDGTLAGTRLLRNIAAGSYASDFESLGAVGPLALFAAHSPGHGRELWVTDGTLSGTTLLREFVPGPEGVEIHPLGTLAGEQLFTVRRQPLSIEIWRSDATLEGTVIVRKIQTEQYEPYSAWREGVEFDGRLFFLGTDASAGDEPWQTDGTDGGTYRLADLRPGSAGSNPGNFLASGDLLAFSAAPASQRVETWLVDAGSSTPRRLALPAATNWDFPLGFASGGLVVAARDEAGISRLMVSDGTGPGTAVLRVLNESVYSVQGASSDALGGRVLFFEWEPATGREPWTTDGTPGGTNLLGDLQPGPSDSDAGLYSAVPGHDGLYFCDSYGYSLWRTDGTPGGTAFVADALNCESLNGGVALAGATLLQQVWWVSCPPHDKCERFETLRTDGTASGTYPLRPPIASSASKPRALTPRAGGLVFAAEIDGVTNGGRRPVDSDGSAAGTFELTLGGGESVEVGDRIARTATGFVLIAEATGEPPTRLFGVDDGELVSIFQAEIARYGGFEAAGDSVFFAAWEPASGHELWASDGTALGTRQVRDLNPGPDDSGLFMLGQAFGKLWFSAGNPDVGLELWESDGSTTGTTVHDLVAGPESSPFFFSAQPLREAEGSLVADSNAGLLLVDSQLDELTVLRPPADGRWIGAVTTTTAAGSERTFFVEADESDAGRLSCKLWTSDGTAAGTVALVEVAFDPQARTSESCSGELVASGERVYFAGWDAAHGVELWTSDGTLSGTVRFGDFAPGPASFVAVDLTVVGDRLYFSGCREATGCEPWVSDFTVAGTHPLGGIAPGGASSDSRQFTRSDPFVYFSADDGTGTELWAVPIELFYDGFEDGNLGRWDDVDPGP